MAKITVCNWCGDTMTAEEENNGINLHTYIGYGTKFDGKDFSLDLCPRCTEEFIEMVEKAVSVSTLR